MQWTIDLDDKLSAQADEVGAVASKIVFAAKCEALGAQRPQLLPGFEFAA
jgi:hypothetical protein